MGQSTQRTARLHFRTSSIPWKNANGTGPRRYRRARTCPGGVSKPRRKRQSCATRNDSVQSLACTSSCCITFGFACNNDQLISRDFTCREFGCRIAFAQCVGCGGPTHRRCFAISRTNGERDAWGKQPCGTECANSGRAMADPDSRFAAAVFCRVAPRASLCPAQHQPRFKHALVSVLVRKETHCRGAFRRRITTFRLGCATGRLGGGSHLRCKMSGGLFDGTQSIASVERRQISRRRAGCSRVACASRTGCSSQSGSRWITCCRQKIMQ